MKNLFVFFLSIVLLTNCEDSSPPINAFLNEPYINIQLENRMKFIVFSESVNSPKHKAKQFSYDNAGIDMNAEETRYWILYDNKTDSFTISYKLKMVFLEDRHCLLFDTIYLKQSSILNSKITFNKNSTKFLDYIPVFYVPK